MKKLLSLFFLISFNTFALSPMENLEAFLFSHEDKGIKTESFLLIKDGKTVFEKSTLNNQNDFQLLWSMSKSVSSLLFGIAEGKGYISREDSLYKYFSKEIDALSKSQIKKIKKIKIKDVLEMSSGFDWNEFYEESPFNSDVVRMLYFETKKSTALYVLERPIRYEPGENFYYSSGDTNLWMEALRRSLPKDIQSTFPWDFLFDPMKIDAVFEKDRNGTFLGSSYLFLKKDGLLKIASLLIDKGMYEGKQLIPAEYISYATSKNTFFANAKECEEGKFSYGAQFWLNKDCGQTKRAMPELPEDMILLFGHQGQTVLIFPTQKTIAMRLSSDKKKFDRRKFGSLVFKVISGSQNEN